MFNLYNIRTLNQADILTTPPEQLRLNFIVAGLAILRKPDQLNNWRPDVTQYLASACSWASILDGRWLRFEYNWSLYLEYLFVTSELRTIIVAFEKLLQTEFLLVAGQVRGNANMFMEALNM